MAVDARGRSAGGDAFPVAPAGHVRMHQNESPYGMSRQATEAAAAALERGSRYPASGSPDLCQALAEHYGVDPAMVAVGAGSIELIACACRAWAGSGGTVVVTRPGFPGYGMMARLVGAEVRDVACKDLRVDAGAVSAALAPGSCAFICDPLNPTGSLLEAEELRSLIEAAADSQAPLVVDEAYSEFAGPRHHSAIDQVRAGADLVVLRTFSKAYGLAGLRVGYAIAPPHRIAELRRWRPPFTVSCAAQAAAAGALGDREFLDRVVARVAEGRATLEDGLAAAGLGVVPGHANFVLAAAPGRAGALAADLATRSFLVQELSEFGLPDHLRVTVGTEDENRALLGALAGLMAETPT